MQKLRAFFFNCWVNIPLGYLLRFEYGSTPGSTQRITLCKNFWIVIDNGRGTSTDALPLLLVNPELVDECMRRLTTKYKLEEANG